MKKSIHLVDAQGEVREITLADLKSFRPARQALPESLQEKVGIRGPQKAPTKERITLRLSPDVVQRFRASGRGWQTKMDAALREWLTSHELLR